ncbi:MAG: hypothetical protein LCI00_31965 [Chloroflexi bacterium]|nr:hypothetical protein [Chloroflexota bacterium]MCC6891988.1 hypothetical protein [Anaerolineae bacterium]
MRRAKMILLLMCVLLALPLVLAAQDATSTPDPFAPLLETTATVISGDIIPLETVAPTETPPPTAAPASPIEAEALAILTAARNDLDILVIQNMGADRPVGWTGSGDVMNIQLPILIRLDLELLAGQLMGPDQRPVGWFGAVPSTAFAIARDIRHDLELLADQVNPSNVRPPGWVGADPVIRCDRSIQTLVFVLERTSSYELGVDPLAPDFCRLAELQATAYAESNLLPNQRPVGGGGVVSSGGIQIISPYAVAFLDRFGRRPTGSIPVGEPITPVARSYTQFSKMMLVRGNGFLVFIDYSASSISENQFAALPDVNGVSSQFSCTAEWCKFVP